jgi:hypothetical protein
MSIERLALMVLVLAACTPTRSAGIAAEPIDQGALVRDFLAIVPKSSMPQGHRFGPVFRCFWICNPLLWRGIRFQVKNLNPIWWRVLLAGTSATFQLTLLS